MVGTKVTFCDDKTTNEKEITRLVEELLYSSTGQMRNCNTFQKNQHFMYNQHDGMCSNVVCINKLLRLQTTQNLTNVIKTFFFVSLNDFQLFYLLSSRELKISLNQVYFLCFLISLQIYQSKNRQLLEHVLRLNDAYSNTRIFVLYTGRQHRMNCHRK